MEATDQTRSTCIYHYYSGKPPWKRFVSNYTEEYNEKPMRKGPKSPMPHKSRNTPHPREAFMVWQLPKHLEPLIEHSLSATSQLEHQKLITKHKVLTTYQGDYRVHQGRDTRSIPSRSNSVSRRSKALPTSMQISYPIPRPTTNLRGNTTRYGCSKGIVQAAHGIVPTLAKTRSPLTASYDTWYRSEFGGPYQMKPRIADSQLKLPRIDSSGQSKLIVD